VAVDGRDDGGAHLELKLVHQLEAILRISFGQNLPIKQGSLVYFK
jgi:hypothetical protein